MDMTDQAMTGTKADLIEHLTREHREVEQLWSQLQAAHHRGDTLQGDLGRQIVTSLSQHDAVELQILYPAIRDHVPGGDQLADEALEEHAEVRNQLSEVDGEDPSDGAVFERFSTILTNVEAHVAEEESTLFPQLRTHCSAEQLANLGEKLETAEKAAPTHPHPNTPDSKLGATVAGAAAGVADRLRDAARGDHS
jgi:hemerythrin superfamily protein